MKAARVEARRAMSLHVRGRRGPQLAARWCDGRLAGREGKLAFTLRRPIGVVGAISPFNFPLNLVAHKLAPTLAADCAVVLEAGEPVRPSQRCCSPSSETEAGLPPGWLNVLVGPASEIGDVLIEDERVKALSCGSGAVGWSWPSAHARSGSSSSSQRDALDHRRDADIDTAAQAWPPCFVAGQSCIFRQAIYVEAPAYQTASSNASCPGRRAEAGRSRRRGTDVGPVNRTRTRAKRDASSGSKRPQGRGAACSPVESSTET